VAWLAYAVPALVLFLWPARPAAAPTPATPTPTTTADPAPATTA
jgi:high-affinity iron transporter